ncbi:hypothetical protein AB0J86_14625 [Micromonospora sp. NPDC049559]|uniref:hypothetical protein n=1 Tax=Micromonospora sp. NPDC049559 TaxID=3155923 RepID=UPI0034428FE9
MDDGVGIALAVVLLVVVPVGAGVWAYRRARAREQAEFAAREAARPTRTPRTGGPATTVADLGEPVERHEVDRSRRGRTASGSAAVGLVCLLLFLGLAVPTLIAGAPVGMFGVVLGLLLGFALTCLWSGIEQGLRYFTHGAETFALHERGLLHSHARGTRAFTWSEVSKINQFHRESWLLHALGRDVICRIRLDDGSRVTFNGFTRDADRLAHAVDQAVYHGNAPRPARPGGVPPERP